ncbi:hypothetical protein AL1_24550 [Alistipes shahii WAL 8301]|uniref:Uncharacterized protein n=1 Tax=Alistipes shahii WAL 8301 TaxID=717959 RepID=D4IP16_9BACT|nr:hypothetical protein AL1_24550 [Alistipes shahii WAL 8301]
MNIVVFLIGTHTLKQNIIVIYNALCSTWCFFSHYFLYFSQLTFFDGFQIYINKSVLKLV